MHARMHITLKFDLSLDWPLPRPHLPPAGRYLAAAVERDLDSGTFAAGCSGIFQDWSAAYLEQPVSCQT